MGKWTMAPSGIMVPQTLVVFEHVRMVLVMVGGWGI